MSSIFELQNERILEFRALSTARMIGTPNLMQPLLAVGKGLVVFSHNVTIGYFPSPYFLNSYAYIDVRGPDSFIQIGENTHINNGFSAAIEHTNIKIGRNVLMGLNVMMSDSDFHGLRVEDRQRSLAEWAKPIEIEDDVFIGSNVIFTKGAKVGRGSVIGTGSIVTSEIPANVIAAGNPAKVIRSL